MNHRIKSTGPLASAIGPSRLVRAWLEGEALAAFRESLADSVESSGLPAPLFAGSWVSGRREMLLADHRDDVGRDCLNRNLDSLEAGQSGVVVTGQQPGWMGGPLYTLYKVATTVALARRLTAAGRPTVPVFWSGDDDDDLQEAVSSRCWDPETGDWLAGPDPTVVRELRTGRSMAGPLDGSVFELGAATWLAERARSYPDPLVRDLAELWSDCLAEGCTWADLNRRAVVRIFASDPLVVVQGNDPSLQAAAGPLYESIGSRLGELQGLVREQGRSFERSGGHAQIEERSVARPLFLASEGRRRPWDPDTEAWPDRPEDVRPGVMLRSPVQDWLLEPRAVIVGPGEAAYLEQLKPVYSALRIPRSPVVPRLFGWLAPADLPVDTLENFGTGTDPARVEAWTRKASENARAGLEEILVQEIGVDPDRARQLADGRVRRWTKGVSAMLGDAWARKLRSEVPTEPAWVFPDGKRQERVLSLGWACGCWGSGLITDVLAAADRHLDAAIEGAWKQWAILLEDSRA